MKNRMQGKTCLVTGASSGIGLALAEELSGRGARVLMVCRNRDKGLKAMERIKAKEGRGEAVLLISDLSLQRSVVQCAGLVKKHFGHIDVLVNNAGVLLFKKEITEEGRERTLATNYFAPYLLSRLIIGSNSAGKPCRIVNVVSEGTSDAGSFDIDRLFENGSYSGLRRYSLSKQAEIYFTAELARRLGREKGTTSNCFYPGLVRTSLGRPEKGFLRFTHSLFTALLRSRFVPPSEAIKPGLFLACSEKAASLNGCFLKTEKGGTRIIRDFDRQLMAELWRRTGAELGLGEKKRSAE